MPQRYLAVHPVYGVYLGHYMGRGFWTKIDHVGQDLAATFNSKSEVDRIVYNSGGQLDGVEAARVITKMEPDKNGTCYATIAECVEAGCEPWDPKDAFQR
jgi:hypothetical protein